MPHDLEETMTFPERSGDGRLYRAGFLPAGAIPPKSGSPCPIPIVHGSRRPNRRRGPPSTTAIPGHGVIRACRGSGRAGRDSRHVAFVPPTCPRETPSNRRRRLSPGCDRRLFPCSGGRSALPRRVTLVQVPAARSTPRPESHDTAGAPEQTASWRVECEVCIARGRLRPGGHVGPCAGRPSHSHVLQKRRHAGAPAE